MSIAAAALSAALVAMAGALLALVFAEHDGRPRARMHVPKLLGWRLVGAAGLAMVTGVVTGWIAAAAWAGVLGWFLPSIATSGRQRKDEVRRIEAVAVWAEMLRDQAAAGVDLAQAIQISATHAPAAIAEPVARLADRLRRSSPESALSRFVEEIADDTADLVGAALLVALNGHARRVGDVLGALATSAREQVSMKLRVERDRARIRTVARSTGLVVIGWTVVVLLTSRRFFSAYDAAEGQLVLLIVGGLFALGIAGLARLDRLPGVSDR